MQMPYMFVLLPRVGLHHFEMILQINLFPDSAVSNHTVAAWYFILLCQ